ncbi:cell division protein SepF [Hydrocoleum sp. CS-953]|uniref:cell division protein SepF n=1 Tax=Microcoleaceae TaxID=1892252 RepID=UPI000B9A473D|nr:cell division protein SepF [Hydrocoleum sp. CS-953]OZH51824.1 cell division protein SepF [Hydrocoleum sp. CS-953]
MNNLFSKLRDFVGLNEPVEYEYDYDEMEGEQYQSVYPPQQQPPAAVPVEEESRSNRRLRNRATTATAANASTGTTGVVTQESGMGSSVMNNVIGMPGALNGMSEVVVLEPRTFEEMPQAIRALRERKSVVLNLTIMDPDQAQRAVDFVAGGTYALDGHQERIGESIFLFTPSCVQVRTQAGVVNEMSQTQPRPRVGTSGSQVWQPEQIQMMQ